MKANLHEIKEKFDELNYRLDVIKGKTREILIQANQRGNDEPVTMIFKNNNQT